MNVVNNYGDDETPLKPKSESLRMKLNIIIDANFLSMAV